MFDSPGKRFELVSAKDPSNNKPGQQGYKKNRIHFLHLGAWCAPGVSLFT